jgi:hypothetical protein
LGEGVEVTGVIVPEGGDIVVRLSEASAAIVELLLDEVIVEAAVEQVEGLWGLMPEVSARLDEFLCVAL